MFRDTIAALIASRLSRTDLSAAILLEMGLAQTVRMEGAPFLPWFTETVDTTQVITANVETLAKPTNFIREKDGFGLAYYDPDTAKYIELPKDDYDALVRNLDPTGTTPAGYAIVGDNYYFRPVPTQGWNLRLTYHARQADPTLTNIENNWMKWAPDLMIGEVGYVCAMMYLQSPAQAAPFDTMRKEAIQRLNVMHEAHEHANRDYRMGGTED